jgi:hypothetical protein
VCTSRDPVQLTRQEPDQMAHQELVQQAGLKPLLLPKAQEPVILHRRALVLDEGSILRVKLFKRTSPACRSSSIKTAERGTVPISVHSLADQDPHHCAGSGSTLKAHGSGSAFVKYEYRFVRAILRFLLYYRVFIFLSIEVKRCLNTKKFLL